MNNTKILGICLLGALFTTTACSGDPAPPPAATTPVATSATAAPTSTAPADTEAKAVAWFDGFCGAVHGYRIANNERLKKEKSGGTVTKKSLSADLAAFADLAGKTVDQLTALAPSPVPNGDAVKKTFVDSFTAARDVAAEGKKKVDSGGSLDPGLKALEETQKHAGENVDPIGSLKLESQELMRAAATAKNCRGTS
ncbi:hypothetical protein JOF53_001210 [Crossiella equi]|uniref:Small secreted protein n=1 Tax=Crossiella equi TaxID=130796 RepID=A0ABS5A6X1_9PSEU|nr:hypothetical protein [Crossiella equi]MBP2472338.1 hypothetical protein [Crossiella equi]